MSRHLRILIAALGGEGGGVLAGWITDAAVAEGFMAQRTSIPGVAQRTGATTYYIEIMDRAEGQSAVMALSPCPGEVDLVVASELLEATRVVHGGFVTQDRTTVTSSTQRVFTIQERMAMGDGRADVQQMRGLVERFARQATFADFGAIAASASCHVNSVLLGAISLLLPMQPDSLRAAIRRDGRAVDANLRGFDLGRNVVTQASPDPVAPGTPVRPLRALPPVGLEDLLEGLPSGIHATVSEGIHRLVDFQDEALARSFVQKILRFVSLPNADDELLNELARHLAVRMSSEDTIRVAQLKLRDERLLRLAREAKARDGDIVEVTEFLKPGPEELLSVLPLWIGKPLLVASQRLRLSSLSFPLKIRTSGIFGFLLLKMLAAMKPWRPKSLRAIQEAAWVDEWLTLVEASLAVDPAAALQLIETASLVRGYGDTWKRGHASWRCITDDVVQPMLSGRLPRQHFADALLQARLAAQADPEGHRLNDLVKSLKSLAA